MGLVFPLLLFLYGYQNMAILSLDVISKELYSVLHTSLHRAV